MMGARTIPAFLCLALLLPALAPPAQAATGSGVGLGINHSSADEARAAGAPTAYASVWIGPWTARYGWGALETMLRESKADGVTPVVYWYYWGDSISPSCVDWGCDGRTQAQWDSMTGTLVSKIRSIMGGATTIVVLENEFNKNGISGAYAPKFDGLLEAKAWALKSAPGVKVVLGFGGWGEREWSRFPRAIAASDQIGFQVMRASTRDSESTYRGAPDRIAGLLDTVRAIAPGKQSFLYDLALSSYPDARWATIQEQTLSAILGRRAEYEADGLRGIIYREVRDNPNMGTHNYYGAAEQHWGLKDRYGNAKASWWTWVKPGAAPAPGSGGTSALTAKFTPKAGNEWWIAVSVQASQPVWGVCASVNGGECRTLTKQWWGDWAASFHAPAGSRVTFTVSSSTGEKATSGAYAWPSGDPIAAAPAAEASFRPSGNNWWVQVGVTASKPVWGVCASVNGGECRALAKQSWGDWAASFHVPTGAQVKFRTSLSDGSAVWSSGYAWPPR